MEDRCLQQEAPYLRGLTLKDLLRQVVDDVTVIAREGPDEASNVVPALHRERRQLESSNPSFGAGFQGGDVFWRNVQTHDPVEERGRLVASKTQICCSQLSELAPRA